MLFAEPTHTQSTESPQLQFPIAPINAKYAELPSTEIERNKLAAIPNVLSKYSGLRTECKIGVLGVKLAWEAIFGDIVMKKCTQRRWNDLHLLCCFVISLHLLLDDSLNFRCHFRHLTNSRCARSSPFPNNVGGICTLQF